MLQRFFNVPATPSYDPGSGGVVLDRVLLEVGGGAAWWATLTARLRAQAAWNMPLTREGKPHRALCEPGVYGLAARGRVALPRRTVLRGGAHVDSLAGWLPRGGAGTAATSAAAPSAARTPLRARLQLLSQGLLPGHDVSLEATWHERVAAGAGAYVEVPRAAALSVASRRRGPLRYRAGVVSDSAPVQLGAAPATSPPQGALEGFGPPHAQLGAVLGGQLSFYPRAPGGNAADGLRRSRTAGSAKPGRGGSLIPQRARVTLGAWLGGIARAPLRRNAASSASSASSVPPGVALLRSLGAEHFAFASAAASVQLGAFSRPLLDYTAVSLRADVAAASGQLLGAARAAGAATAASLGAPAGAAGAPLGCHVTISAAQQLIGPLRLRADLRLSAAAAAAAARGNWPPSAPPPVAGRPVSAATVDAVEAVYGLDVALPAVLGAARIVAWYSPQRREGLAELRFLEF